MPISLYDAFVPSCLQIVGSMRGLIDKAEAFCEEKGQAHGDLLGFCLIEGMLPFAYQVKSVRTHSLGAIEGVRAGMFGPNMSENPASFAAMRDLLDETAAGLRAVSAEEMEGLIGRDMIFSIPAMNIELPFTGEDFLLSFSQPNFYFHATTAYNILRHLGVEIGKRDYLGAMRLKAIAG